MNQYQIHSGLLFAAETEELVQHWSIGRLGRFTLFLEYANQRPPLGVTVTLQLRPLRCKGIPFDLFGCGNTTVAYYSHGSLLFPSGGPSVCVARTSTSICAKA
jgi:hypothetical protein